MLMLRVRPAGNYASAFRYGASDVLELNRGVADRKAVAQHGIQALQNAVAGRGWHVFDQGMSAQRVGARSQAPDVQVMHVQHALDAAHGSDYRGQIDPTRQAFQQNIEGFLDDVDRAPDNQQSDHNR